MKYACFDIGNVLCHVDFDGIQNHLSKTLNISRAEAMYFLNRVQKLHDLGLTNLSDELRDHFKIHSEVIVNEIIKTWNACIVPNYPILDILSQLEDEHGLKIAILSNIGYEHKLNLQDIMRGDHKGVVLNNSVQYLSCDVGCRKPSMLYYHTFLQLNPKFKGSIYVDDLQENLDASKPFGFQTYKFNLNDYYRPNRTLKHKSDVFLNKLHELKGLLLK